MSEPAAPTDPTLMQAPPAAFYFRAIRCPQCATALSPEWWTSGAAARCPGCRGELEARIFPALATPPAPRAISAGERAIGGEAVCFFHAEKKAERSCDRCGRFVCALCDLPMGARHLCPVCLNSGLTSSFGAETVPELVHRRVVWPHIACSLGWVPLLIGWAMWPALFFTGPAAIIMALYGWNKPGSLVHGRRRGLALLAILLGLVQIASGVAFALFMWKTYAF